MVYAPVIEVKKPSNDQKIYLEGINEPPKMTIDFDLHVCVKHKLALSSLPSELFLFH